MPASNLRDLFLLDPDIAFLNHASYGACPRPVFDEYQRWQRELERQPVEFLGRRLDGLLAESRAALADYLGCHADSLVYVTNATWGVNVIIRSLDLDAGDEVLTTNHEYGACTMSWEWLLDKAGAVLIKHEIPLPVASKSDIVESLWSQVNERTKAIYISQITSPTALIFPIEEICQRSHEAGILTIVDGAHAPGQIPVNLTELGVDIYAGNLHKWLCAPKGAGFLYVRPEEQGWVESLMISWGWGPEGCLAPSTFVSRNEWQGTRDVSAFLAVPAAIEFQNAHNWREVQARCHGLASAARSRIAELTGLEPICPDSEDWFNQMISCPVNIGDPVTFARRLYDEFRVEIPVTHWEGRSFLRASFQGYNDDRDLDKLISGIEALTNPGTPATRDRGAADPQFAPLPAPTA